MLLYLIFFLFCVFSFWKLLVLVSIIEQEKKERKKGKSAKPTHLSLVSEHNLGFMCDTIHTQNHNKKYECKSGTMRAMKNPYFGV